MEEKEYDGQPYAHERFFKRIFEDPHITLPEIAAPRDPRLYRLSPSQESGLANPPAASPRGTLALSASIPVYHLESDELPGGLPMSFFGEDQVNLTQDQVSKPSLPDKSGQMSDMGNNTIGKRFPLHTDGNLLRLPTVQRDSAKKDSFSQKEHMCHAAWPFVSALHPEEAESFYDISLDLEKACQFIKDRYPDQKEFMQALERFWEMDRQVSSRWRKDIFLLAQEIYGEIQDVPDFLEGCWQESAIERASHNLSHNQNSQIAGFVELPGGLQNEKPAQKREKKRHWSHAGLNVEEGDILRVVVLPSLESSAEKRKRQREFAKLQKELAYVTGEAPLMDKDDNCRRYKLEDLDFDMVRLVADKMALQRGIIGERHKSFMQSITAEKDQDRLLDIVVGELHINDAFEWVALVNSIWNNPEFFSKDLLGAATQWVTNAQSLHRQFFGEEQVKIALEMMALTEYEDAGGRDRDSQQHLTQPLQAAYIAASIRPEKVISLGNVANPTFEYSDQYLQAWLEATAANESYVPYSRFNDVRGNALWRFQKHMARRRPATIGIEVDRLQKVYRLRQQLKITDPEFPTQEKFQHEYDVIFSLDDRNRPAFFQKGWKEPVDRVRMGEIIKPLIAGYYHITEWERTSEEVRTAKIEETMDIFYQNPRLVLGVFFPTPQTYLHWVDALYAQGLRRDGNDRKVIRVNSQSWYDRRMALELGRYLYSFSAWKALMREVKKMGDRKVVFVTPNGESWEGKDNLWPFAHKLTRWEKSRREKVPKPSSVKRVPRANWWDD